jgi:hypothetical protein
MTAMQIQTPYSTARISALLRHYFFPIVWVKAVYLNHTRFHTAIVTKLFHKLEP